MNSNFKASASELDKREAIATTLRHYGINPDVALAIIAAMGVSGAHYLFESTYEDDPSAALEYWQYHGKPVDEKVFADALASRATTANALDATPPTEHQCNRLETAFVRGAFMDSTASQALTTAYSIAGSRDFTFSRLIHLLPNMRAQLVGTVPVVPALKRTGSRGGSGSVPAPSASPPPTSPPTTPVAPTRSPAFAVPRARVSSESKQQQQQPQQADVAMPAAAVSISRKTREAAFRDYMLDPNKKAEWSQLKSVSQLEALICNKLKHVGFTTPKARTVRGYMDRFEDIRTLWQNRNATAPLQVDPSAGLASATPAAAAAATAATGLT
jgi:hypothetical protein